MINSESMVDSSQPSQHRLYEMLDNSVACFRLEVDTEILVLFPGFLVNFNKGLV